MIRIHLTGGDLARLRFAARPAPLQELNTALTTMCRRDADLLHGRWRRRQLSGMPAAVLPLADLVPGLRAPRFLDVFDDRLEDGLQTVRGTPPDVVRSEIERVHGSSGATPPWIRALHRGDPQAWRTLLRAQAAAFESLIRPVWSQVQDLHRAEFTRHALTVAEHGIAAALTTLVPGSQYADDIWEFDAPASAERTVKTAGRGLLLLPTFHGTGHPVVADLPDHPVVVTYPAGPGLPLTPDGPVSGEAALAAVLGRTRLDVLLLLDREHTTSGLARHLGVSNATASAHTGALRGAGLITTARSGKAVLHRRTGLGTLLVHRHVGS